MVILVYFSSTAWQITSYPTCLKLGWVGFLGVCPSKLLPFSSGKFELNVNPSKKKNWLEKQIMHLILIKRTKKVYVTNFLSYYLFASKFLFCSSCFAFQESIQLDLDGPGKGVLICIISCFLLTWCLYWKVILWVIAVWKSWKDWWRNIWRSIQSSWSCNKWNYCTEENSAGAGRWGCAKHGY